MGLRRLAVGVAGTVLLVGTVCLATPGVAAAATQQDHGVAVKAQPYKGNPDSQDWLGSYLVSGQQVWCVNFAFLAPDSSEKYTDGQTLMTKFGKALDKTVASEISYLLLRFGDTTSNDQAAALSFLLQSWTAAPEQASQLDPTTNDFRQIAYDAPLHLRELTAANPAAAKDIDTMKADAAANHGPWTTTMTAPTADQVIGTASDWMINVLNTASKGLADVPVKITATDATLAGGATSATVNTPADGSPLKVAVTPKGPNPKLVATIDSPAATPKVKVPADLDMQKVVTTGGTTPITSQSTSTAVTPPGKIVVTKVDANTGTPIAGATLELTGADKKSPALALDGSPVTGSDGKSLKLTTASNGKASTSQNLHTPQQVCVVETTPPPGYDQAFDPSAPPSLCATVDAGQTVSLTLKNVPNKVPVAIPAGGPPPTMTAASAVVTKPVPTALVAFGGLLVVAAGSSGLVVARRRRR
jgi:hypothetical protein